MFPRTPGRWPVLHGSKSNIYEKRTIHAKYTIPEGYLPGDFTDEAMELDRYMYAAFTNLLKGSHSTIAKDTAGRASYVMASTRLYSELNKNELPTALKVLNSAMSLKYKGDPAKFDVEAKKMVKQVTALQPNPEFLATYSKLLNWLTVHHQNSSIIPIASHRHLKLYPSCTQTIQIL